MTIETSSRSSSASRRLLTATTAGFLLGSIGVAHAQEGSLQVADAGPIAAAAGLTAVESVNVDAARTATPDKFTAKILDTPKSVSIISTDVIQATAAVSLEDALRTVPGITFNSGEGGAAVGDRPVIRGFDATSDIFIDGIRDAGGQTREVFAIDHIEVLKGPSSAYAGRGTTGGGINIVTKTPKAGDFLSASLTAGTDATKRGMIDFNHAFSDVAAFRLAAVAYDADVAGRDAVELKRWGLAPSLALGLGTSTRATLSYYYARTDDVPDYGIPYDTRTLKPVTGVDDNFYGLVSRDFRKTGSDIGTVKIEHDFSPSLRFSNTSRYGRSTTAQVVTNPDDSRGNVQNGYLLRNSKNRNVATKTLANVTDLKGEFNTGRLKHSFSVGVELSEEKTHNQGYFVNGPGLVNTAGFAPVPLSSRADGAFTATPTATTAPSCTPTGTGIYATNKLGAAFGYNCTTLANPNPDDPWIGTVVRSPAYTDTTTLTRAAFLFDTIELSPQFLVTGGVRFDDYSTKAVGLTSTATTTAPYITLTPSAARNDAHFANIQVGATYKPTKNSSLYVSYGTSSNPTGEGGGDFSVVAVTTENLEPEDNKSYEIGAKVDLRDGMLSLSGALFRTDKTNARVTDPLGNTALIGETRVQGIELNFSGNVTRAWTVFGGYTYLDAEIRNGGFATGGTAGTPVNTPNASTGKRTPNTPKHAFTLFSTYNITRKFQVGGGAQYQSKRFGDPANTRSVDSFWRFDASSSYRISDRIDLQLNVQNLTDKRYALRPYTTHMVQIAPGRSALLTANFHF